MGKLLFLSTLSLRRATWSGSQQPAGTTNFYPRSPCGERLVVIAVLHIITDFYPRSPCGERHSFFKKRYNLFLFLSTLSLRRATLIFRNSSPGRKFLSTLSLRRATGKPSGHVQRRNISIHALLAESDNLARGRVQLQRISIHALLAESDPASAACPAQTLDFYPRSPCGERRRQADRVQHHRHFYPRSPCGERQKMQQTRQPTMLFLSTLSLRRATINASTAMPSTRHFYPRSPCGERRALLYMGGGRHAISIHALLAESDAAFYFVAAQLATFLSTLSLRRATGAAGKIGAAGPDFYPRSPCGERQLARPDRLVWLIFLSTLSLRRATPKPAIPSAFLLISIHALLAESDWPPVRDVIQWEGFLSTLSLRRATAILYYLPVLFAFLSTLSLRRATSSSYNAYLAENISIHALLAESDARCRCWVLSDAISIHALLAESDARHLSRPFCRRLFLSTLSLRRATRLEKSEFAEYEISIHALLAESDYGRF